MTPLSPLDWTILVSVTLLGACVGSFLNVVVYRLPNVEEPAGTGLIKSFWLSLGALMYPPSTCPKCNNRLAWYDNVPVLGWLLLRGKCRFCKLPISPRYPLIEALTAALFAFHYLALFAWNLGPCPQTITVDSGFDQFQQFIVPLSVVDAWPLLLIHLWLIASLLAATLIDAKHFIIPLWICWVMAAFGLAMNAFVPRDLPGNLQASPLGAAVAIGGGVGLILSILLLRVGAIKQSFAEGMPLLEKDRPDPASAAVAAAPEVEWSPAMIRAEMRREMLFLMPPLLLAGAAAAGVIFAPVIRAFVETLIAPLWAANLLGAILGALVGGFVVWLLRIAGSIGFGREAMGLGDVHLMFGVGACLGGGMATVAFFVAPVFGLAYALWMLLSRSRREVPFGPYLSLGSYATLLLWCPIYNYLAGGLTGLQFFVEQWFGQT